MSADIAGYTLKALFAVYLALFLYTLALDGADLSHMDQPLWPEASDHLAR